MTDRPRAAMPGTRLTRALPLLVFAVLLAAQAPTLAAGTTLRPGGQPSDDPGLPPARELIREQLEAGVIDYPTSLTYRAFAFFSDSRLPAEFADHPVAEDGALFAEMKRNWDKLPAATRDTLTPFFVRPNDSRSIFFPAGQTAVDEPPVFADGDCSEGWAARDSERFPFKVWTGCTGDYEDDLDEVIGIIDDFWQRSVDFMGPPILDTGSEWQGGDERIDFYFVEDESDISPRYGATIVEEAAAYAAPDDPFEGYTSSAFVVARRPQIGEAAMTLIMAHEFFHVLQDAHNQAISFGLSSAPYTSEFDIIYSQAEYWFTEATATWVMSYLYRDELPAEVMQQVVHYRFVEYFQPVDVPLFDSPRQWSQAFLRIYAAYVYFLFLEQEIGAEAIAEFYDRLRDLEPDDLEGTTALLDEILPFEESFRDFAVRNLNLDLQPGDPIDPSYVDLDPTFLEGFRPPLIHGEGADANLEPQDDEDPLVVSDAIRPLTASYAYFTVDRGVEQLTLDFTSLTPHDALDIDLLVKIRGEDWERRQLDPEEPVTFCLDERDERVQSFYLVLTNHALTEADTVRGGFAVTALADACA